MIAGIAGLQATASIATRTDADGRRRHRRRPRRLSAAYDGVSIEWDAAEMPGFDMPELFDDEPGDDGTPLPDIHWLAARLSGLPKLAVATQARLGRAAVTRLITVNAVNRV